MRPPHTHHPHQPLTESFQQDIVHRLPSQSPLLFAAKKQKNLSFETIAKALGREEVAVAALFYGQAKASEEDVKNLAKVLDIPEAKLMETEMTGWPDRGRQMEMPPKEPLVYRLFEIVQNYGYAYKAVMNEKFGDGIMSAISFSTKVEKEEDDKGTWCVITLRGKWYVLLCLLGLLLRHADFCDTGFRSHASRVTASNDRLTRCSICGWTLMLFTTYQHNALPVIRLFCASCCSNWSFLMGSLPTSSQRHYTHAIALPTAHIALSKTSDATSSTLPQSPAQHLPRTLTSTALLFILPDANIPLHSPDAFTANTLRLDIDNHSHQSRTARRQWAPIIRRQTGAAARRTASARQSRRSTLPPTRQPH